jgi:hypothetical protein
MFEKRKAKKAQEAYQAQLNHWKTLVDSYSKLVETATNFHGFTDEPIMFGEGEVGVFKVTNCSLVEERKGQGHFVAGSTGFSIPVGNVGGHPVRYRVGATRGHYVPGTPSPTAIDNGTFYLTTKRAIFVGRNHTRECLFAKLIGYNLTDAQGEVSFSVSNREKPMTIFFGNKISATIDFRLDLALALFKGELPQFIATLNNDLENVKKAQPVAPAPLPA